MPLPRSLPLHLTNCNYWLQHKESLETSIKEEKEDNVVTHLYAPLGRHTTRLGKKARQDAAGQPKPKFAPPTHGYRFRVATSMPGWTDKDMELMAGCGGIMFGQCVDDFLKTGTVQVGELETLAPTPESSPC
jgi:hypothetical protein